MLINETTINNPNKEPTPKGNNDDDTNASFILPTFLASNVPFSEIIENLIMWDILVQQNFQSAISTTITQLTKKKFLVKVPSYITITLSTFFLAVT